MPQGFHGGGIYLGDRVDPERSEFLLKVRASVAYFGFVGLGKSLGKSPWSWPTGVVSGELVVAFVRRFGLGGGEEEGVIGHFCPWLVEGVSFESIASSRASVSSVYVAVSGTIIDALARRQ